jgi:hypothetical protein
LFQPNREQGTRQFVPGSLFSVPCSLFAGVSKPATHSIRTAPTGRSACSAGGNKVFDHDHRVFDLGGGAGDRSRKPDFERIVVSVGIKTYFTTEARRSQSKIFIVCREVPTNKNLLARMEGSLAKGQRLMENRYLPILHKDNLLCVLRVSNESRLGVTSGW